MQAQVRVPHSSSRPTRKSASFSSLHLDLSCCGFCAQACILMVVQACQEETEATADKFDNYKAYS